MKLRAIAALVLGPALMAGVLLAPAPDGLSHAGQAALAVLSLCITWWLLTPVALPVTSLLGLALLPVTGALPAADALALFGNQAVFFVIGVFLVAAVMYRTGLSSRLTLLFLRRFTRGEDALATAVLLVSWGLCVIVVSHAVAAIMLPLVLEIIRALDLGPRSRTARRLLLSMAWGTVAGSNLTLLSSARASLALELYAGFRVDHALPPDPIGVLQFSLGSAPVSFVSVLIAAIVLRVAFPPEGLDLAPAVLTLDADVRKLGPASHREWMTLGVIGAMVAGMALAGPSVGLGTVALLGSVALFALQILQWEDAERYVNWGVALMYGGAIAVGGALHKTGATTWLVHELVPQHGVGPLVVLASLAVVTATFTEFVSNAAVIAVVLPVALPIAQQVGLSPRAVTWLAPICAGFAFVLPTSTPALAMVFGTGYLRPRHTLVGLVITVLSLLAFLGIVLGLWPLIGLQVLAPPDLRLP